MGGGRGGRGTVGRHGVDFVVVAVLDRHGSAAARGPLPSDGTRGRMGRAMLWCGASGPVVAERLVCWAGGRMQGSNGREGHLERCFVGRQQKAEQNQSKTIANIVQLTAESPRPYTYSRQGWAL